MGCSNASTFPGGSARALAYVLISLYPSSSQTSCPTFFPAVSHGATISNGCRLAFHPMPPRGAWISTFLCLKRVIRLQGKPFAGGNPMSRETVTLLHCFSGAIYRQTTSRATLHVMGLRPSAIPARIWDSHTRSSFITAATATVIVPILRTAEGPASTSGPSAPLPIITSCCK